MFKSISEQPHLKKLKIFSIFLFIIESIYLIIFNETWFDETNYLYESWLFVNQHLIPYIDYYSKVPVIPYIVYGVPQSLFGTSIYVGRIESAVITGLMLFLIYKITKKLVDEKAGVFAVLFILFNFYSMQYFISATLYSLSSLFILLSIYVLLGGTRDPFKSIITVFFVAMAILTRPNMGFAGIVLLLYILFKKDSGFVTKIYSALTFVLVPLAVLAPFIVNDFKKTLFQIPFSPLRDLFGLEYPEFIGSLFGNVGFLLKLTFPFKYIHETFFMTLIIGSFIIYLLYNKQSSFFKENKYFTLLLAMVLSLVTLTYIFHGHPTDPYIVYAIPMMSILAGAIISIIASNFNKENASYIYSIFLVGLILTTFSIVPFAAPMKDTSVMKAERGAEAIENYTTPDDKILSLLYTNGEVLLAERVVYPHTIHFPWNYRPLNSDKDCEEYFQVNNEMIEKWIAADADVVLISDWAFSMINRPPFIEHKEELLISVNNELMENYTLVETVESSLNPNLKIYVKNENIDEKFYK